MLQPAAATWPRTAQPSPSTPEMVQALQIWYDMVYKYEVADPNIASREATVPYQDFLDGKVAMSLFNPGAWAS